ncbi:MAG: post-COAP-1 domain-containing protein [Fimbriimonadales bacterium]|nr:MAG: hypothetical protein KatS3mg018_0809 [Fimbriimonadales bacterium]
MRRWTIVLFLSLAVIQAAFTAGIATGVVGDGQSQSSEPVAVGTPVEFQFSVVNGASSVQFVVYDSYGNQVYATDSLAVSESGSVSWVWSPPFAGTFTVWAVSDGSNWQQVMLVTAYQPSAFGFITGGGWLELDGARQTFGFVAQVQRNGTVRGSLEYQDHGWRLNLKSFVIDWVYTPNAQEGYFSGLATLNGSGSYRFWVAVWDGGTPGANDAFMLWVYDDSNMLVYSAWGTLASGNLMIHSR